MFSTHLENFLPFLSNLKLYANSFSSEESKICYLGQGRAEMGRNFVPGYLWPYYLRVLGYPMLLRPIKLKINSCLSLCILALAHVLLHLNGQI